MKKLLLASILMIHVCVNAQVAINANGNAPHASAILDVQSNNKGILVPRIALTAANVSNPVTSPADALLIYNTATAGSGVNAVQPGFYYWDAEASRWMAMGMSMEDQQDGNTGFGHWNECGGGNISDFNPVAAAEGMADDYFGYSVSISGDYAVIGAPNENSGAISNTGAAYIYHFEGTQWIEQQKIVSTSATAEFLFGSAVEILDDHMIIGAQGANSSKGLVEFYRLNGGTWQYQQTITASDGVANDNFGVALDMSENSLIVGALTANLPGFSDAGAAYVFVFNGTTWLQQGKLTASDPAADDFFGYSVAMYEEYAIIGAPFATPMGVGDAGAAYVFHYNGASWLQQQKLTASNGANSDNFGTCVDIHESVAFVGAPYVNYTTPDPVSDSGAAYVFTRSGTTWTEQQMISSSDRVNVHGFGVGIAFNDTHAIITAPLEDSQHKATIFRNVNGLWLEYHDFNKPGGTYDDLFGYSVAMDIDRFVIGALKVAEFRGMAAFGRVE